MTEGITSQSGIVSGSLTKKIVYQQKIKFTQKSDGINLTNITPSFDKKRNVKILLKKSFDGIKMQKSRIARICIPRLDYCPLLKGNHAPHPKYERPN